MRVKSITMLLLLGAIFSPPPPATAQADHIAVVVSSDNPATEITLGDLRKVFAGAKRPAQLASAKDVAPILRGACTLRDAYGEAAHKRLILDFRTSDTILTYVNGEDAARYARAGLLTPDHVIRTKRLPMIGRDLAAYQSDYEIYFNICAAKASPRPEPLSNWNGRDDGLAFSLELLGETRPVLAARVRKRGVHHRRAGSTARRHLCARPPATRGSLAGSACARAWARA